MTKNIVVDGDYAGCSVVYPHIGESYIVLGMTKRLLINKETVAACEILNEKDNTSMVSSVAKGFIGGLLFGMPGMVAGAFIGKSYLEYLIAIQFKDGTECLLQVDEKNCQNIVKACS